MKRFMSETVVITEDGNEVVTKLDRQLSSASHRAGRGMPTSRFTALSEKGLE